MATEKTEPTYPVREAAPLMGITPARLHLLIQQGRVQTEPDTDWGFRRVPQSEIDRFNRGEIVATKHRQKG